MGLSGYRERQGQKMATGIHGMIEKRLHYFAVPLENPRRSDSDQRGIRRWYQLPRDGAWPAGVYGVMAMPAGQMVAVAN